MFDSLPNGNFVQILKDSNTSLETVITSKDFLYYWEKSSSILFKYLYKHFNEIMEIGFQTKEESVNSIRCLQIISTPNEKFHHHIITKTNLYQFVHDYIFNISTYPNYSQKNYFYALPNLMVYKMSELNPVFDSKYFTELLNHIDNDFVFNFIIRLFEFAPLTIFKILKEIKIDEVIVTNLLKYNIVETQSKFLLIRNQILFKELVKSKYDGDMSEVIHHHIGKMIRNAIRNPNCESISFLVYLDKISMNRSSLSKWHKVHMKLIPYLQNFCQIILNSNDQIFTPLFESCTLLAISIISSTKDVPDIFITLFKHLLNLFFLLKTNTFLHNCVVSAFKILVSVGKINASFLDELDMFNKIIDCYVNRKKDGYSPNWGQLRLISNQMNLFVNNSKTVDTEKWKKIVMKRNTHEESIIIENYGGYLPFNFNGIKRFFLKHKYYNPSFTSKNLLNENDQPKKLVITSPFY